MLECPENLLYNLRHMWVEKLPGRKKRARVGMTHYREEELPEILSLDLPMVGDEVEIDDECFHFHLPSGVIEHVPIPLTGRILEINREVLDRPDLIHVDPYKHWLVEMEYDEPAEFELLIEPRRYVAYVESL